MTTAADEEVLALDTSVAVPLLMRSHEAHTGVTAALAGRELVLTAHSLAETYSVLTRLPGDARVAPPDAARLIDANFRATLLLGPSTARAVPAVLAALGIAGGAVYDALVGMAAAENDVALATRDARALGTYAAVGAVTKILSA